MPKSNTVANAQVHHRVRTVVAGLLGAVALLLVSASILVIWANRTLTDTPTFVAAVGPVIGRPELQDFVAMRITDKLLNEAPVPDLASTLLTPAQITGKTPAQLQSELTSVIHDSAEQILKSPSVEAAWRSTNQNAHAELMKQLNANAATVTLDLGPFVDATLQEMKQTKLAAVADKIKLTPSSAKVELKGAPLEKVRRAYKGLKTAPGAIVLLTLVFAGLSVWASVHHTKTLRRMLVSTGVSALLVAGFIALPGAIRVPTSDPAAGHLAGALVGTLFHGLQVGCLVLGAVCITLAVGTKLWERMHK